MRERHAEQGAWLPTAAPVAVDLPRLRPRGLVLDTDEGVKRGVQPVDARERRIHQLGGAEGCRSPPRPPPRRGSSPRSRRRSRPRSLTAARAGAPVAIRAAVAVGSLEGVQPLLQRGGLPVEVVVGARGLDRRMKLAELDRQLGDPLVGEAECAGTPRSAARSSRCRSPSLVLPLAAGPVQPTDAVLARAACRGSRHSAPTGLVPPAPRRAGGGRQHVDRGLADAPGLLPVGEAPGAEEDAAPGACR